MGVSHDLSDFGLNDAISVECQEFPSRGHDGLQTFYVFPIT
jgi:hypothetical protein